MAIIIYHESYPNSDAVEQFFDAFNTAQMTYLASDLLKNGVSGEEISKALVRAFKASEAADLDVRKHFLPIYTQGAEGVFNDCKLSELGFRLLLINADITVPAIAKYQLKLLQAFR